MAMPATRSRSVEPHNAHAGQGAVLVDIGGDIGALVVVMPAEMTGVEVEIRPAGSASAGLSRDHPHQGSRHAHHPHVAVVVRPTPEGPLPSLVYPAVTVGEYDLVVIGDESARRRVGVTEGGVVTEIYWAT